MARLREACTWGRWPGLPCRVLFLHGSCCFLFALVHALAPAMISCEAGDLRCAIFTHDVFRPMLCFSRDLIIIPSNSHIPCSIIWSVKIGWTIETKFYPHLYDSSVRRQPPLMIWTSGYCLRSQVYWAELEDAVPHAPGASMARGVLTDSCVIGPLGALKLILH